MTAPSLLEAASPDWAARLGDGAAGSDWLAAPPLPSGTPVAASVVRIQVDHGFLKVAEREAGAKLPHWCPELHLNPDSTFCLGRRVYDAGDVADVAAFWQALGEYLVAQHHASRNGRWPSGRWISHGEEAADRQAEAEALAARAGFAAEYGDCLEFDEGWLAEQVRAGRRRAPAGAKCPRACLDDGGTPITLGRCRRRGTLQRIIDAERARRAAEGRYFAAARRSGRTCCGRMPGCPLDRERIAA